jgi:hypothetical protein
LDRTGRGSHCSRRWLIWRLALHSRFTGDRCGAGPWLADYVGAALPVAYRPRNKLLGVALVAALAVVILQPQLSLPLVALFGLDGSRLAVTCVAVVALALLLAMADAPADAAPTGWFLLTRRNLILSLTVLVIVPIGTAIAA